MSVTTQEATLSRRMSRVREMVQREVPFEHIEMYVESCDDLDEEERAVLWLYAYLAPDVQCFARDMGRPHE